MHVSELSDSNEVYQLEKKLSDTADKLAAMCTDVGNAKQVIEFTSDMRKRALAKAMHAHIEAGDTLGAAEAKGRASYVYGEEMAGIAKMLREAEAIRAEWEATKVIWDSTRSLLAMQREMSTLT